MINLRYGSWVRVARTLASHASLTLTFITQADIDAMGGVQAWTDSRSVYIKQPSPDWTDEQFQMWLYLLIHEVGHNRPARQQSWTLLKDEHENGCQAGILYYIWNLMEDHVQELDMFDHEPVLARHLQSGRRAYYKLQYESRGPDVDAMREQPEGPTLFSWDAMAREWWIPGADAWGSRLFKVVEDMADPQLWMQRLCDGDYSDVLRNRPDCVETLVLSKRIMAEVFEVEEPQQQQQESNNGPSSEGEAKPEDQSGQGEPGSEGSKGQASGDGEGVPGEGGGDTAQSGSGSVSPSNAKEEGEGQGEASSGMEGSEGSEGSKPGQASEGDAKGGQQAEGTGDGSGVSNGAKERMSKPNDYAEWVMHVHESTASGGREQGAQQGQGVVIDYERYFNEGVEGRSFVPLERGLSVLDLTKGESMYYDNTPVNNPVTPSSLSKRIGRYMQAKSRNRKLHGQKAGRLSNRNLHRLKMKGAGDLRERVFHKRIVNKSKDVAVSLVVDFSGSMRGKGKSQAACDAVTHLHEVITGQLRIPLEIIGFSEHCTARNGLHLLFQTFQRKQRNDQIEENMRKYMPYNGYNRDGEVIMWARDRLLQQKADRHIMVVLSDGQPCTKQGDVGLFTKDVIRQVEADKRVDLYAIGILSPAVKWFYQNYEVIANASELEDKLLTVLRNKIIGEHHV